jgi:hypothetical protein
VREPVVELGATVGVADEFDAEADFGNGRRADIEEIERLRGDEGEDFVFWLGTAQFRQDVGIEQPPRHKETSLTGIGARFGSMSMSRCAREDVGALQLFLRRPGGCGRPGSSAPAGPARRGLTV